DDNLLRRHSHPLMPDSYVLDLDAVADDVRLPATKTRLHRDVLPDNRRHDLRGSSFGSSRVYRHILTRKEVVAALRWDSPRFTVSSGAARRHPSPGHPMPHRINRDPPTARWINARTSQPGKSKGCLRARNDKSSVVKRMTLSARFYFASAA